MLGVVMLGVVMLGGDAVLDCAVRLLLLVVVAVVVVVVVLLLLLLLLHNHDPLHRHPQAFPCKEQDRQTVHIKLRGNAELAGRQEPQQRLVGNKCQQARAYL